MEYVQEKAEEVELNAPEDPSGLQEVQEAHGDHHEAEDHMATDAEPSSKNEAKPGSPGSSGRPP